MGTGKEVAKQETSNVVALSDSNEKG